MSNEEMNKQIQEFQDTMKEMKEAPQDDGMSDDQLKAFVENMKVRVEQTLKEQKDLEDKGLEVLMRIIEKPVSKDSDKINAVAVLFANIQMKRDAIADMGMGRG